jgi:diguanylate cyclase (GGDEF)-like protein
LGIGAQLSVAFAAVVGLAIAANLLIEREISVIRTTRIVKMQALLSSAPAAVGTGQTSASPLPKIETPSPKSLVVALEHYSGAIRSRLDIHNNDSESQLATAVRELQRETQAYTSTSVEATSDSRERLLSHINAFSALGDELVHAADARRGVLRELWECFDALDGRTKASLAGSWKIFGRVVARKTLVDLNSSLDEIRREFASLPTTGLDDHDVLGAVTRSQAALAASLEANEAALTHSQGESWVKQTRADVMQIGTLQDRLILLDTQRRVSAASFVKESFKLMAVAEALKAPPMRGDILGAVPQEGVSRDGGAATRGIGGAHASSGGQSTGVTENTSTSEEKPKSFGWIFWVSAGVVTILLWVSIRTVLSVVKPVRRIRSATLKIARGETGVRVTRGGIRELDELAVSFNQMAEQLADAKATASTYQERLEATVSLRTLELQHLADHDPLTHLPNRRQLFAHLKTAIAKADGISGSYIGVFFVDLDNFKNINDSLGHAFGDRVLGEIAARLRTTTIPAGFAARLGGDEFTIVCEGVKNLQAVNLIGQGLVHAFQAPVAVDGRYLMISISVGVSMYPDHGNNAETLLRAADAALFRAKALGRSQLIVFSPALLEAASAKFTIEQGLRYALERGEFELVFQPEVDATSLNTHLVEALLRWRLPDGRLVSPAEFLGIAEESGLIMEISDWVLRTSIERASHWHHGAWPEARIAINLSSRQILNSRFVDRVKELLREHRLPAHCIEVELTENVLQTGAATIDVLHQLRELGIAITLDDFGIGYSSLASLEQLPLTRVKLDRALIAGIHVSDRSAAIARALVGLCHNIGLEVTAEGIEYPEQLALLARLTPIYLQGYLLARPVRAEKLLSVMKELPDHMASLLLTCSPGTKILQIAAAEEMGAALVRA